jgi:hypothetical protein
MEKDARITDFGLVNFLCFKKYYFTDYSWLARLNRK